MRAASPDRLLEHRVTPPAPCPRGRAVVQLVGRAWGTSYPSPVLLPPPRQVTPPTGGDTFDGTTVKPKGERDHNPDHDKWSVISGLTLRTATVTNDLYWARNTLTHRIQEPASTATIRLDYAMMRDGQQLEHHRRRSRERRRHGRSHLAARGRRHPPRRLPSGNLLPQHRRHQRHPPEDRVDHGKHLAALHGLPLRPFQLRRAGTRRLGAYRTVRADHTPSAATFLPRI